MTGIEPATPCLQSRRGETLKGLSGVAYTENWRNFRSLKCPEVVPNFSAPLNFRKQTVYSTRRLRSSSSLVRRLPRSVAPGVAGFS